MVRSGPGNYHVLEAGSGSPAVIFESGVAATSLSWSLVQPEVARFTRTIAYDRAGLGWSELVEGPRTPPRIAAELRDLLHAAKVDPPFVIVGHSFGGLVASRFAMDHADEIAGVVLVDALSPADFCPLTAFQKARIDRGVALSRRGGMLAKMGIVRLCLGLVLGGNQALPKMAARLSSGQSGGNLTDRLAGEIRKLPREVWPSIAWHWSLPKSFESMARHLENLPESCAGMSNAVLPDVPVTVISAAANHAGPGVQLPPRSKLVRAEQSGHWIQLDEPLLVAALIRELVDRARR